MKCLQGLYFNSVVRSWKSTKLTPHIAIRDPKTGISRQGWFGTFFIFNSFSFLLQPHDLVLFRAHCCRATGAPACVPSHSSAVLFLQGHTRGFL